ncbi:OmpH family outer membrane protein [Thermodesulfovibrio thiophilus]|uniref:OmpH family outer membrane protein n=1 Tax=Thermodesulfovibrio thiophilus TaxID=340095 RepID=UPI0018382D1E|nr:OmpH family outer membrane protein [Thermodesulfovibrio thiophilus]HHW21101.1 OmpH family outer membrane protein [Thermodesulfovibrio thiophilus]
MKIIVSVVCALIFVMSYVSLTHAEVKIGVVDLYKILNESEEGKKAVNDLQVMLEQKQKALSDKQNKIQSLKEELDKKRAVLSEDIRKSKEEEIERLSRDFQRTATDYQVELQKKQNEITQSMLKEIRQLINEFAQKEGYNLIIEKAEQIILYTTPEVEITDKIIAIFNQKTQQPKGKK